jgi:hypothetical protein
MAEPAKPRTHRRPARAAGQPARKDEIGSAAVAQLKTARWRIAEAGAAIAAFLLSLGVFMLGGLQSLRGSEIVVLPPDHIILYRDAPAEDQGVLVVAAETGLINTAAPDYGDVAARAYLSVQGAEGLRFPHEARVEPVYVRPDEDRQSACPVDARCIVPTPMGGQAPENANSALLVIERRRDLLVVPGGSGRSSWMSFSLSDCRGEEGSCHAFRNFSGSLAELRSLPDPVFQITLDFHSDGSKTATCGLEGRGPEDRAAFFNFLEERGWAVLRCREFSSP